MVELGSWQWVEEARQIGAAGRAMTVIAEVRCPSCPPWWRYALEPAFLSEQFSHVWVISETFRIVPASV